MLEKAKSLGDFLSGLFYLFIVGKAAVKIDPKQFGAADSLYNLILESDLQKLFFLGKPSMLGLAAYQYTLSLLSVSCF